MKQILKNIWMNVKYFLIAIFFFIFVIFSSLLVAILLSYCFESELSSWFQAVGTIFAIISGFLLTLWQIDRQRIKMNRQAEQIYASTYDAAEYICVRMNNVQSETPKSHRQKSNATQAIKFIQDIPFVVLSHSFQNQVKLLRYYNLILIKLVAVNEGINDHKDIGNSLNSSKKKSKGSRRIVE